MKKRLLMMTAMVLGALTGLKAQQGTVVITGRVAFPGGTNKVTVQQSRGFESVTLAETEIAADSTYRVEVPVEHAGAAWVVCAGAQRVRAWLEDENLGIDFRGIDTAKVKILNPPYVYIKGGPKNNLINVANYINHQNYQNSVAYSKLVYNNDSLSQGVKKELFGELYKLSSEESRGLTRSLIENAGGLSSVVALLSGYSWQKDSAFITETLAQVKAQNPGSAVADDYLAQLKETDAKRKAADVGQPAPDFELPTQKGKLFRLSWLKGKVVLIDFWASWCGPCRAETPNLKKTYERFKKNKQVAFLSVSIDSKREDWLKALDEEQLEWTQLLAPNSGREVLDKYQFNGIPFIIAIGKDGRIFRKFLRGEAVGKAIEDALAE